MTSPYQPEGPYIHPRTILKNMPCVTATPEQLRAIAHGRNVQLADLSDAKRVKVYAGQDKLVAICERVAGPTFHPITVLYNATELAEILK